jgi:hypothetical protein
MTSRDESITLIRELLVAGSNEELQELIALNLPRMDDTFFSVLTDAAQAESGRNPAMSARLLSLAQILLPLRTLI